VPSAASLRLQREDLVVVSHTLEGLAGPVERAVAATKLAWPLVVDGLSQNTPAVDREPAAAAAREAAKIKVPTLFEEAQAATLTGPGAEVAGLFRDYTALVPPGWRLIDAAITEIERGPPSTAHFARENVALYIESVYDANFTLAQIGKKLLDGYRKLGGAAAFGASLTQPEVDLLATTYSEATDRLRPHAGVRLGS
jgi:hypothetical protein